MKTYKILIIGAGPGGISIAAEARAEGISKDDIILFEKAEVHSFVIRSLYPENKKVTANYKGIKAVCHGAMCLPDTDKHRTISYMDKVIENAGINVQYSEEVYKVKPIGTETEPLFEVQTSKAKYQSHTVIVAIGVFGKPNKPSYELPKSLKNVIHFDVNSFDGNKEKILVVGGGDSASEYAQYLIEKGNQVSLSYRKNSFNRMNPINKESALLLAEQKKLKILWQSNIELVEEQGKKVLVKFSEDVYNNKLYDRVVYALGGSTPENFLSQVGIDFEGKDLVVNKHHESKIKGLFVAGDLVSGKRGGSIVAAFNSSRVVVSHICNTYLSCFKKEEKLKFDFHALHFIDHEGSSKRNSI